MDKLKSKIKDNEKKIGQSIQVLISGQCDYIKHLLLKKNKSYGNSAIYPENIFGNGDAIMNLASRIDDKLARIKNAGINDTTEDTIDDLAGYLILLKIAVGLKKEANDRL